MTNIDVGALLQRYEAEIGRLNGVIIRQDAQHTVEMSETRTQMNDIIDLLHEAAPEVLQAYNERIAAGDTDLTAAPERVEPAQSALPPVPYVDHHMEHPELDGIGEVPVEDDTPPAEDDRVPAKKRTAKKTG